jgi:hypothetical protein
MKFIRACIDTDLADDDSSFDHAHLLNACQVAVKDIIHECAVEAHVSCPGPEYFHLKKMMDRKTELACVDACEELSASTRQCIANVVNHVRDLESTRSFHAGLLACQTTWTCQSPYDFATFAYGTTPFQTWRALFQLPPLQACVEAIRRVHDDNQNDHHPRLPHPSACTVFGASTGSIVMYIALLCGIPVRGIEILPFLVTQAQETLRQIHAQDCDQENDPGAAVVSFDDDTDIYEHHDHVYHYHSKAFPPHSSFHVTFVCQDMLETSLDHVQLLILTSQCWSRSLWHGLVAKLTRELASETLVLDYTSRLSSVPGFTIVASAQGSVSWHEHHRFYLFHFHKDISTAHS